MKDYPRFTADRNVDPEAGCYYLYVYSSQDKSYAHCHDFYEIFIVASGDIIHWVNGSTQKLSEGSLVFIRPDDVHYYVYDNPQENTEYINLAFSKEVAQQLFAYLSYNFPSKDLLNCDMPPTVILNSIEKKHLLSQIGELNVINWHDKKALNLRVKVLLADVFTRHFYNIEKNNDDTIPPWLSHLTHIMEQPKNFIAGIDKMTEVSNRSREHISRCLKKYLNLTPSQYINDLRINYASNLLISTDKTVIDICYDCGFQNLGYFYTIFKNKYNCSPKSFREQYKPKNPEP